MAFLDNSGDIILDAVLTDLGRKRMTSGEFSIQKFGLGDDEINYGTYNLAHPSGSAYYDLEIMQTPVFEATTSTNANINYGLQTLGSSNLLYLPTINFNYGKILQSCNTATNMFYIATNSTTRGELEDSSSGTPSAIADNVIQAGSTSGKFIVWEAGLDSYDIPATADNRLAYLVNQSLEDSRFLIEADSRFIFGIGGLTESSYFRNNADNTRDILLTLSYRGVTPGTSTEMANYNTYTSRGISNQVTEPTVGTGLDTDISAIKGPRGSVGALNIQVPAGLATEPGGSISPLFINYGTTGATLSGDSSGNKYDYIDTIIFVTGMTSGATAQIPVRIIRCNTAA